MELPTTAQARAGDRDGHCRTQAPITAAAARRRPRLGALARAALAGAILLTGVSGTVERLAHRIGATPPAAATAPAFIAAVPAPVTGLALAIPAEAAESAAAPAPVRLALAAPEAVTGLLLPIPAAPAAIERAPYDAVIDRASTPGPSDPEEILTFGPVRIKRGLAETIVAASRATDVDPALMMAIADKESSFIVSAEASSSSATGLFQFIERTWLGVVRDFGPRHGLAAEAAAIETVDGRPDVDDDEAKARILALRNDPRLATLLAGEMLKRDIAQISGRIGREPSIGEIYLLHFLGPSAAERFLDKLADKPKTAAAKLLPKPAKANRRIFFARKGKRTTSLSVAEVHQKFEEMMGPRLDRYRGVHAVMRDPALGRATAFAETE